MGAFFSYRREVDGLRALAVVPVILFHAGFQTFSGGFVGVDVFFVISGYLITSVIVAEFEQGRFSLAKFYERRVRRIFPALFLVMACCIPPAWIWLMPNDLKEFSQSLVAVATFSSNFLFWKQSSYFDTANELKPLLHTWSLAVEEQYYLLFPILFMFLWKRSSRLTWMAVLLVATVSFGFAQWSSISNPSAAFYLLPTRIWELLMGALIALYLRGSGGVSWGRAACEVYSLSGLLVILLSVVILNDLTPFPGVYALLPTGGAALIILFARKGTLVHSLLSSRPFVGLGLVSYSAYLWHQPLFAFTRNAVSLRPAPGLMFALGVLVFGLSYLTWRLVESPFRNREFLPSKGVLRASLMAIGIFVVLGVLGIRSGGYEGRFKLQALYEGDVGHLVFHKYLYERFHPCTPPAIAAKALRWDGFLRCVQSRKDFPPEVAIVGDSHAEHLFLGLAEAMPDRNIVFYIKGAAPFLGSPEFSDIFRHLSETRSIRAVILAANWAARLREVPRNSSLDQELSKTIKTLQFDKRRIFLATDVPSFRNSAERCKFGVGTFSNVLLCSIRKGEFVRSESPYRASLTRVAREYLEGGLIDLQEVLCDSSVCSMVKDGVLMFRDSNHLNIPGSRMVGTYISKFIQPVFK